MKRLDPTLAEEPRTDAAQQSDRFCHHFDRTETKAFSMSSMCGYPAVGWVDGVTACQRHYDKAG